MANKREIRSGHAGEFRIGEDGKLLTGYAAVWDQWEDIFGDGYLLECLRRGCFRRALQEQADVRALFNHDPSALLGRTAAQTLRLAEDDKGLAFEVDLPDTQLGRDVPMLVKRRDLTGCSFGFSVNEQKWTETALDDGSEQLKRELLDVDLYDVGPVTFPAYTGTSVDSRSLWPDGIPYEMPAELELRMAARASRDLIGERELRNAALRLRFEIRTDCGGR